MFPCKQKSKLSKGKTKKNPKKSLIKKKGSELVNYVSTEPIEFQSRQTSTTKFIQRINLKICRSEGIKAKWRRRADTKEFLNFTASALVVCIYMRGRREK